MREREKESEARARFACVVVGSTGCWLLATGLILGTGLLSLSQGEDSGLWFVLCMLSLILARASTRLGCAL